MFGIPRLPDDIVYEVRVVGEQRVYRVRHRRMMEWANEQACAARPTRTFGAIAAMAMVQHQDTSIDRDTPRGET
jgi:hypothetical protein